MSIFERIDRKIDNVDGGARWKIFPQLPPLASRTLHIAHRVHDLCKYAPNIDPTSSSTNPVDIVRILRMAEEPTPALVATLMKPRKSYWIKRFDQRGRGQYCARFYMESVSAT